MAAEKVGTLAEMGQKMQQVEDKFAEICAKDPKNSVCLDDDKPATHAMTPAPAEDKMLTCIGVGVAVVLTLPGESLGKAAERLLKLSADTPLEVQRRDIERQLEAIRKAGPFGG